jgi:hypothetical protein
VWPGSHLLHLLLAHFLLGHNIGGNVTDRVRRIVYCRLRCQGHEARWPETFLDAFAEYEPVREAARVRESRGVEDRLG